MLLVLPLLLGARPAPVAAAISSIVPDSGSDAGGDTVRINMTRVRSGATVTIGGQAATITDASYGVAGWVEVTTPAGTAGAVDVVVTDYHGVAVAENAFTYQASGGGSDEYTSTNLLYFNSGEPGGDGSDPNVLFADDFGSQSWETRLHATHPRRLGGGAWYHANADNNSTTPSAANFTHGWEGSIWTPIAGNGVVLLSPRPAFMTSDYAATTLDFEGEGLMAEHELAEQVEEFYCRLYWRFKSGYGFGAEKILTLNQTNGGGIKYGNWHINCGAGSTSPNGSIDFQPIGTSPEPLINTGYVVTGDDHWHCFIFRHKLSSSHYAADGILQMWADDCGLDGVSGPASPTLRFSRTDYRYPRPNGASDKFGSLWFESWSNPVTGTSNGERLMAQIMVSKSMPGFSVGS